MQKNDKSFCTYRGHAHTLARGASVVGVIGELMQRDCGLMRGKGGSMHLTDTSKGVMGSYAIIGAHLPMAVGSAWRAQYLGDDDVEAINAISGERCSPHPHNFTDRMFRPGDQAFFDILQSYQGYRTCYYRTFNVGIATSEQNDAYIHCREWLNKAIELIKPGVSTDTVAKVWPKAEEFGFSNEMQAFGLQFGHGLGLALHERPIISRLVSLENPMEIKTGMVFALETYCPAKDGVSAARIEEEVVVTDKGCKVISLFPAEDLPIANKY
jgi:Xaa-Pro dipeptidase